MNAQILQRTQNKLKENEQALHHQWTFQLDSEARVYDVFPSVFSPAIFAGSAWLTSTVLRLIRPKQAVLEIGTGCGVAAVEIALRVEDCMVSACDLNEQAVANAKANAEKFNANITIRQSDVFQSFKNEKFDIIYWNFPFHPSERQYEHLSMLEKAVRDPEYRVLKRFLQEANEHLEKEGILLLGFSIVMGDLKRFSQLADETGWKWKEVGRIDEQGLICLIQLQR